MTSAPNAYRPRPDTKLGRAYLGVIDDGRGTLEPEELEWLRANPGLWLWAINLHLDNVQYRMRASADHLEQLKPEPGENPAVEYLRARKEFRRVRQGNEHKCRMLKVRAKEIAAEFGMDQIPLVTVAELLLVFTRLHHLAKQDDFEKIEKLTGYWINKLGYSVSWLKGESDELDDKG